MKGPLDRTKVVLRRLPPTISQSILMEQVDSRFAGRYNLLSFRPGKIRSYLTRCSSVNLLSAWSRVRILKIASLLKNRGKTAYYQDLPQTLLIAGILCIGHKHQYFSRAYINFTRQEDVVEFAEFFNGHVFVNEKGTQFKSMVEYAPSQRVPKQCSKKDGREGTILKDREYLEFLELLAKPVEYLPSAEVQLERKEAGQAGAAMNSPIITPLMDYVRQKRAAKGGSRRPLLNGRLTGRRNGASSESTGLASSKRRSEKKKNSTTMYVSRDSVKSTDSKEKSSFILVSKRDNEQRSDKSHASLLAASGSGSIERSGTSRTTDLAKKKIMLLKGKEKEVSFLSGGLSEQQDAPSSVKKSFRSTAIKQNQQCEASGRIIRSILLNKDMRQSEQQTQSNEEKDKRPGNVSNEEKDKRPGNVQLLVKESNGLSEDKVGGNDMHGFYFEKHKRRTRNKERPDRGVWTPLRRLDGSCARDESSSSSASQPAKSLLDSPEGAPGEMKIEMSNAWTGEYKSIGSGRGSRSSVDNGSHKHSICYGPPRDGDNSTITSEGRSLKRGGSSCYGSLEKQVWVQKSSGS